MKKILLISSGIDSHCAQYLSKPDVMVYFDTGQSLCKQEIKAIKSQDYGDKVIIDNRFKLDDQVLPNDILPMRNAYFALAGAYYGEEIILVATAGDTTNDKDEPFVNYMNDLFKHMFSNKLKNPDVSINGAFLTIPYRHFTKTQLIEKYLKGGGSVLSLLKTRSCYSDEDGECGKCRSCIRKYTALKLNGQTTKWNNNPQQYIKEAYMYAVKNDRKAEIDDLARLNVIYQNV
jgi:7-cyano-7-deazaguanine synthase in queuosine biosynthesis